MDSQYSPQIRLERLIATARTMVGMFALLAISWESSEPSSFATIAYGLLLTYAGYALILAVLVWWSHAPLRRVQIITHGIDLLALSLCVQFTTGPIGPFFIFFVFSLVGATLRWQWRGTLWTALVALATFIGIGLYMAGALRDPAFDLTHSVYLIVVAILLGYVGAYEKRVYTETARLASWPRATPLEARVLMRTMLEHATGIMDAPRALMIWEESEEPWVYLAAWSADTFQWHQEPPATLESLVAEPLARASFLCPDVGAQHPTALYTAGGHLQRWHGVPLHRDLLTRFAMRAVLSMHLCGETFHGRLFFLDKRSLTSDDLVLGAIVAHQVTADLDQFYLSRQLQHAAVADERIRLARDLHDGLLQSLTGAALQLETVQHLITEDPQTARQRLLAIQQLMTDEQRQLRSFVRDLEPSSLNPAEPECLLDARLREVSERIERQWGLHVSLSIKSAEKSIPRAQAFQIQHIVNEALVNAARHAHASAVCVELEVQDSQVHITVVDNGRGFPFQGRYDLPTLTDLKAGPRTLKERISSLAGSLTIDSTAAGARLEVCLPLALPGA
jgi:signal transduction histidine kinase